jgi:hypothetical protein
MLKGLLPEVLAQWAQRVLLLELLLELLLAYLAHLLEQWAHLEQWTHLEQ